uniref:TIL domain-containing protein n=1 Tax=Callorhinchus milii TaxID=7868 RepID=A0A4W3GE24_CALMI
MWKELCKCTVLLLLLCVAECGGGQVWSECGQRCPRSCEDLSDDVECLDLGECRPSCGCGSGQLIQDGECVHPAQCQCHLRVPPPTGQCWLHVSCSPPRSESMLLTPTLSLCIHQTDPRVRDRGEQ